MRKANIFISVLLVLGLFVILSQLSSVGATTALVTPANYTNHSATMSVNCTTNLANALFVLIWYNFTHGAADGVLVNISGTAGYWNFSNSSALISSLKDATNYTFWCEAVNTSMERENSTYFVNTHIGIDNTAPIVKVYNSTGDYYNNASMFKNANTSTLTLNVSISDATTSVSFPYGNCIFDINGTNETVAVSNGWCNSSALNLTGLAEGNQTIRVWVNDSAGNWKVNNSFVVWIDTINPSPSASCSDISIGDAFPCSCSASDGGVGVSSSGGSSNSPDGTSFPVLTGGFTYTCSATDRAGNTASTTSTYIVAGVSNNGGSGGGSSSAVGFWTKGTLAISENQFQEGYTKKIVAKQRVRVKISGEDHHVGVKEVSGNIVKIEVSSDPQEANLAVGDSRKFDITDDGYYDVLVTLNGIADSTADLTIKSIYEKITEETEQEEKEKEVAAGGEVTGGEEKKNKTWTIIIVILILAALVGAGIARKKSK